MASILSFSPDARPATYLHGAYPAGIVDGRVPFLDSLAPYHFNLCLPNACLDEKAAGLIKFLTFFPPLDLDAYRRAGVLQVDTVSEESWESGPPALRALITDAAQRAKYVLLIANERKIPGALLFKGNGAMREVYMHPLLLLGSDRDRAIGMTYRINGTLGQLPIAFEALHSGLAIGATVRRVLPPWKQPRVTLIDSKVSPVTFSATIYQRLLEGFLAGEATDGGLGFASSWDVGESLYGVNVYDRVKEYFKTIGSTGGIPDLRVTKVLEDQAKILARTVQEFHRRGDLIDRELIESRILFKLAMTLHVAGVRAAKGTASDLSECIARLDQYKHAIIALTSRLLARMKEVSG